MRYKSIYLFVFDGFLDADVAGLCQQINDSSDYRLQILSIEKRLVRSASGWNIMPDVDFLPEVDLVDIDPMNTSMLILPGGSAWSLGMNEEIAPLVTHCLDSGIVVAAIGDATTFLARMGVLNDNEHTSNNLSFLKDSCSDYQGQAFYRSEPVVVTRSLITAGKAHCTPFTFKVLEQLEIAQVEWHLSEHLEFLKSA